MIARTFHTTRLFTVTAALLASVSSSICATTSAKAEKLTLVSNRWPPFTDSFEATRIALDIVHLALLRIGIEAETQIIDQWATLQSDLKAGIYDGSGTIWNSPERSKYLHFSDPYLENRLILIGKKGLDVSAQSLDALKGKRLGLVKGYAYGDLLESAEGVHIHHGPNDMENIKSVWLGQCDYALVDSLVVHHLVSEHGIEAEDYFAIGLEPILIQPLHFALRIEHPHAISILENFNREIRIMQADGSYHRILRLSWIRTDIDADGRTELVQGGPAIGPNAPLNAYDISYTQHMFNAIEERERYWIDGHYYDDWNQVRAAYPDAYENAPSDNEGFLLFKRQF